MSDARGAARALTLLRGAYGVTLLARPRELLADAGLRTDAHALAFARVLGARHLVQALVLGGSAHPLVRLGALVDGVHAATVLAWAALDEPHRRGLLVNAAVATALAVEGLHEPG